MYYYLCEAMRQLRENYEPNRVVYWARRWHMEGVWELPNEEYNQYCKLYRSVPDENPLAARRCEQLAPKLYERMLKRAAE